MARLNTVEDLRRVLPPPKERTFSKILDHLDKQAIGFLETSPFALVSTTSPDGTIEVSPKGDLPGFIHVESPTQVLIPERAGNNLAFGLQNILGNGRIGAIALSPNTGETLRFSGRAEILDDPDLLLKLSAKRPPCSPRGFISSAPISIAPARCCGPGCGSRKNGRRRARFPSARSSPRSCRRATSRRKRSMARLSGPIPNVCGRTADIYLRSTDSPKRRAYSPSA